MRYTKTIPLNRRNLLYHAIDGMVPAICLALVTTVFLWGKQSDFYNVLWCVVAPLLICTPRSWKGSLSTVARVCNGIRTFRVNPGLVITDDYFEDYSSLAQFGKIPWTAVKAIERTYVGANISSHEYITVRLNAPNTVTEKHSGFQKFLVRLNRAISGSPILISADSLQVSPERLFYELMVRFDPDYVDGIHGYAPLEAYLTPYIDKPAKKEAVTR